MSYSGDKASRGLRVAKLRERRGVTVLRFAADLNAAAEGIGLPATWTGPRVTKIEQGQQNLSVEDVATLEAYEPSKPWFWWAFGVDAPIRRRAPLNVTRRAASGGRGT